MCFCASGCRQGSPLVKPGSDLVPEFPYLCSTGAAGKDHLDLALRLESIRLSAVGKRRERSLLSADVHATEQDEQHLFKKGWQPPPAAVQDEPAPHTGECIAPSEGAADQRREPE